MQFKAQAKFATKLYKAVLRESKFCEQRRSAPNVQFS
jgi:hypothetical protein